MLPQSLMYSSSIPIVQGPIAVKCILVVVTKVQLLIGIAVELLPEAYSLSLVDESNEFDAILFVVYYAISKGLVIQHTSSPSASLCIQWEDCYHFVLVHINTGH